MTATAFFPWAILSAISMMPEMLSDNVVAVWIVDVSDVVVNARKDTKGMENGEFNIQIQILSRKYHSTNRYGVLLSRERGNYNKERGLSRFP